MRMRKLLALSAAVSLSQVPVAYAHPHLFVGVDVEIIFTDQAPTAVRITWKYDDFFSLLLTSDLGIDLDGDLILDAEEVAILTEAVTDWPADFKGDLEVQQNGRAIALGSRTMHTATYDDGLISETHVRPILDSDLNGAAMTLRVYDPLYYVAYSLNGPITFEGRDDCSATVTPPDLNAAYSLVDELLYGRPASEVGPDESFPEVGIEFAETIDVTCAQ